MKRIIGAVLVLSLLCGSLFASGTGAGTAINALATNIELSFSGTTKNAAADGLGDWTQSVAAIHGLVEKSLVVPGALTGLVDGTYSFQFGYLNRGNTDVVVDINRNFVRDAANHWSVTGDSGTKNIAEDAIVNWDIDVVGASLLASEAATLSVTATIQGGGLNVVSYNAFVNAVSSEIFDGAYGGTNNITHTYTLVAQGADLAVLSRTAVITDALGGSAAIPGAKILYTVVVRNNNATRILDAVITDKVPNACHFYSTDAAAVAGLENIDPVLPTGFGAAGTDIQFSNLDIPANGTVTMSYTVTID